MRSNGPSAVRVVAALAIGLGAGVIVHALDDPVLNTVQSLVAPLGKLWVNAILMTVMPLVVSSLVVGVVSIDDARLTGRLAIRAAVIFLVSAGISGAIAALVARPALARLSIDESVSVSLLQTAITVSSDHTSVPLPTFGQWLAALVPSNALQAAAENRLLAVVITVLAFALALSRVPPGVREPVIALCRAIDAGHAGLDWVGPWLGIRRRFRLGASLTARLGAGAVAALGYYVVLVSAISFAIGLAWYPVAVLSGHVSFRTFAAAVARAQTVAFAARSSLASLPALLEGAARLGVPSALSGMSLSLAVATFKVCAPIIIMVGTLFFARLYGTTIGSDQLVYAVVTVAALSFAAPGVPGGGVLAAAPVLVALGLPVDGVGILIAIDTIPDISAPPPT